MGVLTGGGLDDFICINEHRLCCYGYEIQFDLKNMKVLLFDDEDSNIIPTLSPEIVDCNEEPESFILGSSVISFLELDFEKYNALLNDFVKGYLEYGSKYNTLTYHDKYDFLKILSKNGIEHIYFETVGIDGQSIHIDDFEKMMFIDIKKTEAIQRFVNGLCYSAYPIKQDEHTSVKKPSSAAAWTASSDLVDIFSCTPLMKERAYCEVHISGFENRIKKVISGTRYQNISPLSFCVTELLKMIDAGIKVNLCKNCGRFFISQNNYATDYCSRPYNKKGQTCKDIGAQMQYKSRVKNNPIRKEYEKAYKRNYAKATRGDITKDSLRKWTDEASAKRDITLLEYEQNPSQDIIDKFKLYLGNK